MSGYSTGEIWLIIAALGAGTYLIRLSFLGFIRAESLPPIVLRALRYTPVAVLPALVMPLVVWTDGPGSPTNLVHVLAAMVTVAVGWRTKKTLWAAAAGGAVLLVGAFF